jgi:hypothetical protein
MSFSAGVCVIPGFVNEKTCLKTDWAKVACISYSSPWFWWHRWQEPAVTTCRGAIGDAFESEDASLSYPADIPGGGFSNDFFHVTPD